MKDSIDKKGFISLKEASEELGVTKFTLRELLYREQDTIDAFMIDDGMFFRKDDYIRMKERLKEMLKE